MIENTKSVNQFQKPGQLFIIITCRIKIHNNPPEISKSTKKANKYNNLKKVCNKYVKGTNRFKICKKS